MKIEGACHPVISVCPFKSKIMMLCELYSKNKNKPSGFKIFKKMSITMCCQIIINQAEGYFDYYSE